MFSKLFKYVKSLFKLLKFFYQNTAIIISFYSILCTAISFAVHGMVSLYYNLGMHILIDLLSITIGLSIFLMGTTIYFYGKQPRPNNYPRLSVLGKYLVDKDLNIYCIPCSQNNYYSILAKQSFSYESTSDFYVLGCENCAYAIQISKITYDDFRHNKALSKVALSKNSCH